MSAHYDPHPASARARRGRLPAGLLGLAAAALGAVLVLLALAPVPAWSAARDDGKPVAALSLQEVAKGTEVTVTGTGWRPKTLVMVLVCGQNMIGGTNSCANADGTAVSVDASGRFAAQLPVVGPPKPCPCVVDVASVNGDQSNVALPVKITDHPVAELPAESGTGRLAVLTGVRLEGDDGVLTWFGAPPARTFVVTVGNLGSAPVTDPVFQIGTAHGVFAPTWEEHQWKGTIAPGQKARVAIDVSLGAGDYGDYALSLKYGEKVLATQPWGVDRPYGVLLFWVLLCVVIPAGIFRIGMAVVDRVRPRVPGTAGRHRGAATAGAEADRDPANAVTARLPRIPAVRRPAVRRPGGGPLRPRAAEPPETTTAVLPWFTPDGTAAPGAAPPAQTSAPSEDHPTTKGQS
ncbi:neocarzinostatin apoprotein domain-containing protein [Streptomyces sp. G-G2]|uniref:neocarzinostatin apoprotein domain-containing protein n=1 Tax=Streptomyces sp. G-G2 TaxID=3046201 RepID=UPI0024BB294A|nr:neocarzinostatin apoprotein domain-containing protein [Streptomyces sp. G-G2]MDJ0380642.1 neocarzinostatin apoprotein domain-containing protein [Streptomyces sp. G-G2]